MRQTTNTLLMVEPCAFGFNEQTAKNNYFQHHVLGSKEQELQQAALREFSSMVDVLRGKGIRVIILKDTLEPLTMDSIFPNNWAYFHGDGRAALFPMYAPNRRMERREDVFQILQAEGFVVREIVDYSGAENENRFLESTGSMVLDHKEQIAYASLSERTDEDLFHRFCSDFEYQPVVFHSYQWVQNHRLPIYHTNVMMSIADQYAIICADAIDDKEERACVVEKLRQSDKEIILISEDQLHCFAGNVLQVENKDGKLFLIISQQAFESLTNKQRETLQKFNEFLMIPIPVIERYGGGGVRCMLAEIFLPTKHIT